jgi:hypothetical protein
MAKRNKKGGWNDSEWMAIDNALCFETWLTIDQIANDANVRPGTARSILEEMSRNNEAIRRGKKYKRV